MVRGKRYKPKSSRYVNFKKYTRNLNNLRYKWRAPDYYMAMMSLRKRMAQKRRGYYRMAHPLYEPRLVSKIMRYIK